MIGEPFIYRFQNVKKESIVSSGSCKLAMSQKRKFSIKGQLLIEMKAGIDMRQEKEHTAIILRQAIPSYPSSIQDELITHQSALMIPPSTEVIDRIPLLGGRRNYCC